MALPDAAFFDDERFRNYRTEPLPGASDAALDAAIDALAAAEPNVRDRLAGELGPDAANLLLSYAERAASLLARSRQPAHARRGLLAVALAWQGTEDPRDGLPALGLLHHAIIVAALDPQHLFAEAATLAPKAVAPLFSDFLRREDLAEIAAVMGYIERTDASGLRYYRTW